jgi:Co/Zn/Cd efflux system component
MPAFGWSIGDTLGSVELIRRTLNFTYESYNASDEYAAFTRELSFLTRALNECARTRRDSLSLQDQQETQDIIDQCRTQINVIRVKSTTMRRNLAPARLPAALLSHMQARSGRC